MARSFPTTALLAAMTLATVLVSGAYAAGTCDGQTLDKKFDNCIDLPHLGAFLHYTYDPANTSISVAFIAKPATSSGWVSWGINPVGPAMLGTQAFVAYLSGGVMNVLTYNVSGYSPVAVKPAPLSFATWDMSGKAYGSSGEFVIYATAKVPVGSQKSMAHVWQVGASVNGTALSGHAMTADNLKSFGKIDLTAAATAAPAPSAPGPSPSPSTSPSGAAVPVPSPGPSPAASPKGSNSPSVSPATSPKGSNSPSVSPATSPKGSSPSVNPVLSPAASPRVSPSASSSPSPVSGQKASAPAPSMSGRLSIGIGSVIAAVAVLVSFVFF